MRRRKKFSIAPKFILIFFLILCLILIITSYVFKSSYSPVRNVVGSIVTPMQRGINAVGKFFYRENRSFEIYEGSDAGE